MIKPSWVIHYIANGLPCSCCGKIEYPYLENICNAHTHGMDAFHQPEFQIVLGLPPLDIMYILNTLGDNVRNGARYNPSSLVEGIFVDCLVRLDLIKEDGEQIFRVIIPDNENRFPEEVGCTYPYSEQTKPLKMLANPDYRPH